MKQNRRGRPTGYKMSAESKAQIARSKTGQKQSKETIQKRSNSLIEYFENHPEVREKPKITICKGCGVEVESCNATPRTYCDECINHIRHNGKIGEYKKIYRKLCKRNTYKLWKLKVLIRDKFLCRNCGKVGQLVHHLIDIMKIQDIPELLYNPDIGLTLCTKCHGNTHTHIREERLENEIKEKYNETNNLHTAVQF